MYVAGAYSNNKNKKGNNETEVHRLVNKKSQEYNFIYLS